MLKVFTSLLLCLFAPVVCLSGPLLTSMENGLLTSPRETGGIRRVKARPLRSVLFLLRSNHWNGKASSPLFSFERQCQPCVYLHSSGTATLVVALIVPVQLAHLIPLQLLLVLLHIIFHGNFFSNTSRLSQVNQESFYFCSNHSINVVISKR